MLQESFLGQYSSLGKVLVAQYQSVEHMRGMYLWAILEAVLSLQGGQCKKSAEVEQCNALKEF